MKLINILSLILTNLKFNSIISNFIQCHSICQINQMSFSNEKYWLPRNEIEFVDQFQSGWDILGREDLIGRRRILMTMIADGQTGQFRFQLFVFKLEASDASGFFVETRQFRLR